jgi:hypothetical protein
MKKTVLFSLLLLSAVSCYKTYHDGPKLTFRKPETRLAGTWYVTKYTFDTIDATSVYEGIRWQFMHTSDSLIVEGNIKYLHEYKVLPGHWQFNNGYSTLSLNNKGIFQDTNYHDFQIDELSFRKMHLIGGVVDIKNNVHTVHYYLTRY